MKVYIFYSREEKYGWDWAWIAVAARDEDEAWELVRREVARINEEEAGPAPDLEVAYSDDPELRAVLEEPGDIWRVVEYTG